jgi:hypothetical protein
MGALSHGQVGATQSCFVHSWLGHEIFKVWVNSCRACAKISAQMVQETFVVTSIVEDILSTKDKPIVLKDLDRWQSLGHIVTFAHHVFYWAGICVL